MYIATRPSAARPGLVIHEGPASVRAPVGTECRLSKRREDEVSQGWMTHGAQPGLELSAVLTEAPRRARKMATRTTSATKRPQHSGVAPLIRPAKAQLSWGQ